jgi:hypothetical protein
LLSWATDETTERKGDDVMPERFQGLFLAAVLVLQLGSSIPASADIATIELDMGSFTYETIDVGSGAPTLTWIDQRGDASAYATGFSPDPIEDDESAQRTDWLTGIDATAAVPVASALAHSALLRAHAEAQPSQGALCGHCVGQNYGLSSANNNSAFELSGAGGIAFRVNYSAVVESTLGSPLDYATGILDLVVGGSDSNSFVALEGDTEGTKSQTGTLVVELFTDDPESMGSLTVQSHAGAYALASPIPEPETAWLLLAALAAAGWVLRRRLVDGALHAYAPRTGKRRANSEQPHQPSRPAQ